MSRTRLILRGTSIALALVLAGLVVWRATHQRAVRTGGAVQQEDADYGKVRPFSLIDQNGRVTTLEDFKGRPWIADFVFTRCQGPCPLVSKRMSDLHEEFKGKDLRFASFSVDPEFDTPNILKAYAKNYKADEERWRFLTGPRAEIYGLIKESFHLAVEPMPQDAGPLDIVHSLHFVLVDETGSIRGFFNSNDREAVDRLREKLKKLP